MILDSVLDATLPLPERDWDAPFEKRFPSSLVFAMARAALRTARPPSEVPEGTRAVAFGNLGDQLRFLSVLSRFPVQDVTIDANAEAAGATILYERVRAGAIFPRHGLPALVSRADAHPSSVALVPHPFVTQPLALVHAMRNAVNVVAASTGEFADPAGAMKFVRPDRTSWRTFYESFLKDALGAVPETTQPRLRPELRYRSNAGTGVVLHVLSGYAKRAMPSVAAHSIARALLGAGLTVTLLGTATEEPRLRHIASDLPVQLFVGRPLASVAALMATSRAFIGVDSGMMNLADAVGIPSVILYPLTDPTVEGPYYTRSVAIAMSNSSIRNVSVLTGRLPVPTVDWSSAPKRVLDALAKLESPGSV